MSTPSRASASAKKEAPEPDIAAAPAAAAATQEEAQARRRRRVRVKQLGRGYEYMDLEPEPGASPDEQPLASVTASDQGAGALGFAGTARKEIATAAAGLTTLPDDGFGGGPRIPMMPGTWSADSTPPPDPSHGEDNS